MKLIPNRTASPYISIHALREEGDCVLCVPLTFAPLFLSTPSARRATDVIFLRDVHQIHFYPRPPRGGRLHVRHSHFVCACISIHALREEGDLRNCGGKVAGRAFLSTPSARRATCALCAGFPVKLFLSTPSARRATVTGQGSKTLAGYFYPRPPRGGRHLRFVRWISCEIISIHALREEGDHKQPRLSRAGEAISIHALREEGDREPVLLRRRGALFLSTPSARRATACGVCAGQADSDFYPRPPRGGRHLVLRHYTVSYMISIHALREEGDCRPCPCRTHIVNFYPRPPRGGRQQPNRTAKPHNQFLSTPSARRATGFLLS